MNILTVEDNEINARLMEYMLKDLDFEYKHSIAEDADRALELTSGSNFDLILMDINLGHGQMDGTEVMNVLRKKEQYKDVPMFAVTCYSLPGDRERFLEAGFDKYFSKPVNRIELLEAVTSAKK